jgi:hypothetical protein
MKRGIQFMTQNGLTRGFRQAGIAATLFLLVLAAAAAPARIKDTAPGISIKNFGKVNANYYRGSQPTEEEVAQLKRLGIKTVIDLRKDKVPQAADWVKQAGLQYFNIPLKAGISGDEGIRFQ